MSRENLFTGKSVVVTGAGAGMGRKITEGFLAEGATVIAVDINENTLEELKKSVNNENLITYAGDISRQDVNENMIYKAVEATGKIDILVNNAGIAGKSEPITETENEDWERIIAVDLTGPMYAIRVAVEQMLKQEQGGNIVTIASVAGLHGCRSSVAYTVAKHGLIGLCEHTAYTYMHKGIRSNMVCPGAIRTGMVSGLDTESEFGLSRIRSGMDSQMPFGQAEDVAEAVLYLASDKAKFINGAKLVVDGGISCN